MSNSNEIKFRKIVYLDEQAVLDYLQLNNNGEETKIIKKMSETVAGIEAEGSVGKNFFSIAKLKLSGNSSHRRNNIVETQLSATLISSFVSTLKADSSIEMLSNLRLSIYKNSAAYYRNLVPIMHMIDDINKVSSLSDEDRKNFSGFNIQGMEKTLDLLSAYYDFICQDSDGKKSIVRFNISGMRNNYNLNDLTKMDLQLFGIKVGEAKDLNLEFNHQLDTMLEEQPETKVGADFDELNQAGTESSETIPIIDILMAGV